MPYVIICKDKPDSLSLRLATRDVHIAYLDSHASKLLAAGALLNDDGSGGDGGVIIYDTEDRAVAKEFIDNDPFAKAGLFESVTIRRWRKAYLDGTRRI
jgi:uncharacterized protein YciI